MLPKPESKVTGDGLLAIEPPIAGVATGSACAVPIPKAAARSSPETNVFIFWFPCWSREPLRRRGSRSMRRGTFRHIETVDFVGKLPTVVAMQHKLAALLCSRCLFGQTRLDLP